MTDKLQPGPEADARVAEAMGWTDVRPSDNPDCGDRLIGKCGRGYGFIPPYTTTGDGLLAMLEWGARNFPRWYLRHPGSFYEASFVAENEMDYYAWAATPNLAVAEALLAAVDEKEKDK